MAEMRGARPAPPKSSGGSGGGNGRGPEQPDEKNSVMALLQQPSMLAQLKMALPRHVTPERLSRIVMTQLRQTPALMRCTRESLLGSIMQAAQLGLEPGVNGQAYLVPYKNVCQLIVGYRGMAQLAWRSALIASISSRAVFEGDHFFYDYGDDVIQHRPCGESDPDKLTHAWAIVRTTTGGRLWEVLTRRELEELRGRSATAKSGARGPWDSDYAEMCKKTVLRRLFKIAPASAEMQRALTLEDAADTGEKQEFEFDIPVDGYSVEPASQGPAPTPEDDVQALLQLDVTIGERANEFTSPERAKLQIVATLEKEYGPLRELRGERLREAILKAGIVQVSV